MSLSQINCPSIPKHTFCLMQEKKYFEISGRMRHVKDSTFIFEAIDEGVLQSEDNYYTGTDLIYNLFVQNNLGEWDKTKTSITRIRSYKYQSTNVAVIELDQAGFCKEFDQLKIEGKFFMHQEGEIVIHKEGKIVMHKENANEPFIFVPCGSSQPEEYQGMYLHNLSTNEKKLILHYDNLKKIVTLESPFLFESEDDVCVYAIRDELPLMSNSLSQEGTTTIAYLGAPLPDDFDPTQDYYIRFYSSKNTWSEIRKINTYETKNNGEAFRVTFYPALEDILPKDTLYEILPCYSSSDYVKTTSSNQEETDSESTTDDLLIDDIEHVYVISIDNAPIFYTNSKEEASEQLDNLSSRFVNKNLGSSLYSYFVEKDEDIVFIKCRLKFSIFSYDRLVHVLRSDRVDKIC